MSKYESKKRFDKLITMPLVKNDKKPILCNWQNMKKSVAVINDQNKGIVTGKVNNLTVLDIDNKAKDGQIKGIEKWNEYIMKYGEPQTLKQNTPTGGLHYLFNHAPYFFNGKNKQGFGYCTIDIRAEGGYIVCEPSTINNVSYKFVNTESPIIDMPESLIMWLNELIQEKQKKISDETKKNKKVNEKVEKVQETIILDNDVNEKIKYNVTEKQLMYLLNGLDTIYFNDYTKWAIFTSCMKSINQSFSKNIWDEFSKKGANYDFENNLKLWDQNNLCININYLVHISNNKLKPFKTYLDYQSIDKKNIICQHQLLTPNDLDKTINNKPKYLKQFNHYIDNHIKTIIIKSDTGTGKTTNAFKYLASCNKPIVSIGSRISLLQQQKKNFEDNKLQYQDYQVCGYINFESSSIVCIDSLQKYCKNDKGIYDLSGVNIYIDEVNSLIRYILTSDTLDKKRIFIFNTLCEMIKTADTIICTDADISDLVFLFFNNLRPINTMKFIDNPITHYNDILGHKMGLNSMIDKLKEYINNDKHFIACFNTVSLLNDVLQKVRIDDLKNRFVVHTSEKGQNIDVTKWKDNFVFYSPKIVYGLDYNISPSDVFVFIDDRYRTIDPIQVVQQLTRQRLLHELFYCIDVGKRGSKDKLVYETLDELIDDHEIHKNYLLQLNIFDWKKENQENKTLIEQLYYLNAYNENVLNSHFESHFKTILKYKGFKLDDLSYLDVDNKNVHDILFNSDDERKINIDDIINDRIHDDYYTDDQITLKYLLEKRCEILSISLSYLIDDEFIYDIVVDDHKFKNHLLFKYIISTDRAFNYDVNEKTKNDLSCHILSSSIAKVAFLRKIEKKLNISKLGIDYVKYSDIVETPYDDKDNLILKAYLKTFPDAKRNTPITSNRDLFEILAKGYNHIANHLFTSIAGKRQWINKKRIREPTTYQLNTELLLKHVQLVAKKDKMYNYVDDDILKLLNIERPEPEQPIEDVQEFDNKEYLFEDNEQTQKKATFNISECHLTDQQRYDKFYDDKHKKKIEKMEKEIKQLNDMNTLNETPEEKKKRLTRMRVQRCRENKKKS